MERDRIRELGLVVTAAFPDDRGRVLARSLASWLEPDDTHDFLRCRMCDRKRGGMGVAPGEYPFFGHAGGWDEAGGVLWFCLGCTSEADALLSSLSIDAMLADVVRALRAADDAAAIAAAEAGFAARASIAVAVGECFCCEQTTRVASAPHAAICARCAATALIAFEKGSASTR